MTRNLLVDVAFWVFGLAAVWFGWRVFRTDSMVRASFSLLASLLNAGAIMLLLLGEYLGMAIFFMMAVEMTVMAIFMVAFMMNPGGLNPMQMVHQHGVAIGSGGTAFAVLATIGFVAEFPDQPVVMADEAIRALGHELMGGSMMLMESVGVTLLTTMIGGAVLASKWGRFGAGDEGSSPPAMDPHGPQPSTEQKPPTGHHGHGGH